MFMKIVRGVLIALAVVVVILVAKYGRAHRMSAADVAAKLNQTVALPAAIDKGVTLRSITGEGKSLVFLYSLDTYDRGTLDPQLVALLEPQDKTEICRLVTEMRRSRVAEDIRVTRTYVNSRGARIHSTHVVVSSCP